MDCISRRRLSKELLEGNFDVCYPKDNSKEAATILANTLQGGVAIIEFVNQNNKIIYGILYDRTINLIIDDQVGL